MIIYGMTWKHEGPFQVRDVETAYKLEHLDKMLYRCVYSCEFWKKPSDWAYHNAKT